MRTRLVSVRVCTKVSRTLQSRRYATSGGWGKISLVCGSPDKMLKLLTRIRLILSLKRVECENQGNSTAVSTFGVLLFNYVITVDPLNCVQVTL